MDHQALRQRLEQLTPEQLREIARTTLKIKESQKRTSFEVFQPQEQQLAPFASEAKETFIFGGNRSGKSVVGAVRTVIQATGIIPPALKGSWTQPIRIPSDIWVGSIDFDNSRDVAQKKIKAWLPAAMIKNWRERDHILELTNGSIITFKSYESGATAWQGTDKDFIWLDEEPPKDIISEARQRLLDRAGDLVVTETPTLGLTWTFDDIVMCEEELKPAVRVFYLDTEKNPHISQEEVARLKRGMTADEIDMRLHGLHVSKTGAIWRMRSEVTVCEPFVIPADWNRYRIIDPGVGHPTGCLWLAVSPDNRHYYYREYEVADMDVKQNAAAIKSMSVMSVPDEEVPGAMKNVAEDIFVTIIDPNSGGARQIGTAQTLQTMYLIEGIPSVLANDNVDAGLDIVRQNMLQLGDGHSKIQIFATCTKLCKAIRGYVWGSHRVNGAVYSTGKPRKIKDELPDCLRYGEMYDPVYQSPQERVAYDGEELGVQNKITGY